MLTRSDITPLLEAGLRADFMAAFREVTDQLVYSRLATVVRVSQPVQRYGWLGSLPAMREFVDERQPQELNAWSYLIEDRTWEATLAVERRALEDDQIGAVRMRIQELGREAAHHRDRLVIEALLNGFDTACYDGKPLFASNHLTGAGAQVNTTSAVLSNDALQEAISAMMLFADDKGRPLGINPNTLLVGPRLRWTAAELLESPVVVRESDPGTPYRNALQGALSLVVSPHITGTEWFVLDTSRTMRGVIFQERQDVPLELRTTANPVDGETLFLRDVIYCGARARYGVGYGLWQTVYGAQPGD